MIYPMLPLMGTHMIPPYPPLPQYISVNQVNQFQKQQQHDEKTTQISDIAAAGSIIGGRNYQASLQICNNNRQNKNLLSKQGIGGATDVYESPPNNFATNEADNNSDACFLYMNFIPIEYTNRTAGLYP